MEEHAPEVECTETCDWPAQSSMLGRAGHCTSEWSPSVCFTHMCACLHGYLHTHVHGSCSTHAPTLHTHACALHMHCVCGVMPRAQQNVKRHDDCSRSLAIFDKITSAFAWHCGLRGLRLSCTDMPYLRARSLRWCSPSSFACGLM